MAQHPLMTGSGIDWTRASAVPLTDYTNLLYADYETDTAASFTNVSNGGIVATWFNIGLLQGSTSFDLRTSSSVWPYSTNSITPTGKPAVDFIKNDNNIGVNAPHWGGSASNQPNTMLTIIRMSGGFPVANPDLYDCSAGSRTIAGVTSAGFTYFSGSGVFQGNGTTPTGFFLLTIVYSGANSYVRTNGVLVGTGNPGTGAMGNLFLGNDITAVSKFVGEMSALRLYNEVPSTNNLHTAEQNLATRYLGITLPSP